MKKKTAINMLKCKYILYLKEKGKNKKNLPKKRLRNSPQQNLFFLIYTRSCMLNTAFNKEPRSGLPNKEPFSSLELYSVTL